MTKRLKIYALTFLFCAVAFVIGVIIGSLIMR